MKRPLRPLMKISIWASGHAGFFRKGLIHDFGSKLKIFYMFVSSLNGPTNYVWGCFRTVERPFINVLLLASYHAGIFPKWLTHDLGSKLGIFCVCL